MVLKDRGARNGNPMTIGHLPMYAVAVLTELAGEVAQAGAMLRVQSPLNLPPMSVPGPDGLIVRRDLARDAWGHRGGGVLYVIEVADSSLDTDLTTKLELYAGFELPEYLVVDVGAREVVGFTRRLAGEGRYGDRGVMGVGEKVRFELPGGVVELEVGRLFV